MSLQLLLVRHGESEGNAAGAFTGHGPSPITARGRRQAEAVGRCLAAEGSALAALYSSDLPRAVQTAEALREAMGAAHLGTPLRLRGDLRERAMGAWEGVAFTEIQTRHPEDWQRLVARTLDHSPPGGESHRAVGRRVAAALTALCAEHAAGRVVVVSHGVAIHHMLRHLLGVEGEGVSFTADNCSVQRLSLGDGQVRAVALNDTRHLLGV